MKTTAGRGTGRSAKAPGGKEDRLGWRTSTEGRQTPGTWQAGGRANTSWRTAFETLAVVLASLVIYHWFFTFGSPRSQSGPKPAAVQTSLGTIKGRVAMSPQGKSVEEFLGIPFAEPPVGQLRYRDPVPLENLPSDPYVATDYKNTCIQYLDWTYGDFQGSAMWNAPNPLDEDCLYLNIWVPTPTVTGKKKDVLVWIYGGGFYAGSNALWVYDGKALAAHGDVIVASLNYRVGSFGYLSTGDGRIKGNFGMKDQVLALRWIKDHIDSFGGDPDKITIFGESSGASSAGLHMMSSYSEDLFHRAIFESGSPDSHWSFMTQLQAQERSAKFLSNVGCQQDDAEDLLTCLRELNATFILNNEWVDLRFMVFPWVPTVDGDFLVDTPYNLLSQGRFQTDKESLLGVNRDEGTFWILYALPGMDKDTESLHNRTMFLDAVDVITWDLSQETRDRLVTLYTPEDPDDLKANRDNLDKLAGDRSFTCPTKELTRILTQAGVKSHFYYLTYRASNEVWPPWMGVIHGAEIQWVFGMALNGSRNYNEDEVQFAKNIMSYWVNFAKTGDPNGKDLPEWPQYRINDPRYIEFRGAPNDFAIHDTLREDYCPLWNEIGAKINEGQPVR